MYSDMERSLNSDDIEVLWEFRAESKENKKNFRPSIQTDGKLDSPRRFRNTWEFFEYRLCRDNKGIYLERKYKLDHWGTPRSFEMKQNKYIKTWIIKSRGWRTHRIDVIRYDKYVHELRLNNNNFGLIINYLTSASVTRQIQNENLESTTRQIQNENLESTMTNFRFRANIKVRHTLQANDWVRTDYFVINLKTFTISNETTPITTRQFRELRFISESIPRKLSRKFYGTYQGHNENINFNGRTVMNELTGRKRPNRVDVILFGKHSPKLELAIIDVNKYNELKSLYKDRTKSAKLGGSKKNSKRMRKIYTGPHGGKYIKKNGRKIYISSLKK